MLVVPSFTENVVLVIVAELIFSLNVPLTVDPIDTPVTPFAGAVPVTEGLAVSIVIMTVLDAGDVLPAASLTLAVML